MSDLDIRRRLDEATRSAFGKAVDATDDLTRGRRARRRRRLRQAAAGSGACAVAGAAVVAGVPLVSDEPSDVAESSSASASGGGQAGPDDDAHAIADRLGNAISEHLGEPLEPGYFELTVDPRMASMAGFLGGPGSESEAHALVRDDVRRDAEPVPLRCADDPAYETCERQTLDDGTEVVVGRGADDLLVAAWGRDGDLVEATAHWAEGSEHNVTLDELIGLATDDRMWIPGTSDPSDPTKFLGIPGDD